MNDPFAVGALGLGVAGCLVAAVLTIGFAATSAVSVTIAAVAVGALLFTAATAARVAWRAA